MTAPLASKSWGTSMIPSSPPIFLKRGMLTLTHGIEGWYSHQTSRNTCPRSNSTSGTRSTGWCQNFRWRRSMKSPKYFHIWEKTQILPQNRIKSTTMWSRLVMMSTSSGDNSGEAALVLFTYTSLLMAGKLLSRHLTAVMFIKSSKLKIWFYKR